MAVKFLHVVVIVVVHVPCFFSRVVGQFPVLHTAEKRALSFFPSLLPYGHAGGEVDLVFRADSRTSLLQSKSEHFEVFLLGTEV